MLETFGTSTEGTTTTLSISLSMGPSSTRFLYIPGYLKLQEGIDYEALGPLSSGGTSTIHEGRLKGYKGPQDMRIQKVAIKKLNKGSIETFLFEIAIMQ